MRIINGKNAVMGRLAAYAAKEALKGEEIVVVNCREILITGSKKNIKAEFEAKRKRVGSGQQGPKVSRLNYKIVKRTIRGMLPNARTKGRGREALKRIKCYDNEPSEFKDKEKILFETKPLKSIKLKEIKKCA